MLGGLDRSGLIELLSMEEAASEEIGDKSLFCVVGDSAGGLILKNSQDKVFTVQLPISIEN